MDQWGQGQENPTCKWSNDPQMGSILQNGENTVSSTSDAGKPVYPHAKE